MIGNCQGKPFQRKQTGNGGGNVVLEAVRPMPRNTEKKTWIKELIEKEQEYMYAVDSSNNNNNRNNNNNNNIESAEQMWQNQAEQQPAQQRFLIND